MSRSRLASTIVLVSLALSPLPGNAQGTAQTHTVKKGDTLWDLAQQYLGDPFKWPEIYRRNTGTVKDPNLIYPDQVLVITGDVAASPGTPADTGMRAPTAPVEGVTEGAAVPQQPAGTPPSMTIFNPDRFKVVRGERETFVMRARSSAVRAGDYARAPFLWDAAGIAGAGRVGATAGTESIAPTRYARPIQIFERVFVTLPANATGAPDERFVAFRYGPTLAGEGRVVIPTGVFKLLSAPQNGQAEALMLTKYEDVYEGQQLMPSDAAAMAAGQPARVEFGLRTTVLWLYDEPIVPSIGQHMILAAGSTEGLVPGDQVTLQVEMGTDAKGVPIPPTEVAVLQVTRVTNWGASAILIGTTEGVVHPGMIGRVSAKMP